MFPAPRIEDVQSQSYLPQYHHLCLTYLASSLVDACFCNIQYIWLERHGAYIKYSRIVESHCTKMDVFEDDTNGAIFFFH